MQDKFSYYDFIANIIPGVFLWWGLTLLPFFDKSKVFKGQSDIENSVVFIVLAYIFGVAIQFLAKHIIERAIINWKFWGGRLYSDVCWQDKYCKMTSGTRKKILDIISTLFNYSREELETLKEDTEKSCKLSREIYFEADAYTSKRGMAVKAHTQYTLYGLFRGLSVISLLLSLAFLFALAGKQDFREFHNYIFCLTFFLLFVAFIYRAKDRGERYVNGLFYSLASENVDKFDKK